jgi:hypothetical protein
VPADISHLLFGTVCGGGALYALFQIGRSLSAQRWPSVEGEIASTRLVHRYEQDGDTDYEYVAYRYEVDGKPYRNDRVRFGPQVVPSSIMPTVDPEPNSPYAAAALARRYPRGTSVRVYYNPRDPADSTLHRAPSFAVWVILGVGVLFAWIFLRTLL